MKLECLEKKLDNSNTNQAENYPDYNCLSWDFWLRERHR